METRPLGNGCFHSHCIGGVYVDATIRAVFLLILIHRYSHRYDYVYSRQSFSGVRNGANTNQKCAQEIRFVYRRRLLKFHDRGWRILYVARTVGLWENDHLENDGWP